MSQYECNIENKRVLFGFDKPLNTFFCSVVNIDIENQIDRICDAGDFKNEKLLKLEQERIELWIGCTYEEIMTMDTLVKLLIGKVDLVVINEIQKTLIME
jgi:hypothetical protein